LVASSNHIRHGFRMPQGLAERSPAEVGIRVARPEDAPAVVAIYNDGIQGRLANLRDSGADHL